MSQKNKNHIVMATLPPNEFNDVLVGLHNSFCFTYGLMQRKDRWPFVAK